MSLTTDGWERLPKELSSGRRSRTKPYVFFLYIFGQAQGACGQVFGPWLKDTAKVGSDRVSWCSCGLSHKQPRCDGRHKGTGYKPVRYRHEWTEDDPETVEKWLCGCKMTQSPPWCDGSHNTIETDSEVLKQKGLKL